MLDLFLQAKNSQSIIRHYLRDALPYVNQEIDSWREFAKQHMQGQLQEQALASIESKRFHCQGGSFYALYPGVNTCDFIRFVVALQTISDYLDNLSDRAAVTDEAAFQQLHLAMTDALDPFARHKDYYADYPYKEDGGYLDHLVETCQKELGKLPSYHLVKEDLLYFAKLYSQLQTYKHIDTASREETMRLWLKEVNTTEDLSDWEFAAATGSTLGMFMLAAAAADPQLRTATVKKITAAYFPWISGLHIQLDYFIDQAEDLKNNDLNFIFYYTNDRMTCERLTLFYQQAYHHAALTPHAYFAKTVVCGLAALYLSDAKIQTPAEKNIRNELLRCGGISVRILYWLCKLLRFKKVL